MGKRSFFKRNPRDFYPTPYEAVMPLLPHLTPESRFIEPCCGNNDLVNHLEKHGHKCILASDISSGTDALTLGPALQAGNFIITNPPWDRKILHPMLEHFRKYNRAWILLDADWMHTKQSSEYINYCSKIISVGRIKWIPGSKSVGKDNCAWYCFETLPMPITAFFGR